MSKNPTVLESITSWFTETFTLEDTSKKAKKNTKTSKKNSVNRTRKNKTNKKKYNTRRLFYKTQLFIKMVYYEFFVILFTD